MNNIPKISLEHLFIFINVVGLSLLNIGDSVQAQIIPDHTLGNESSQLTPTVGKDLITGGAIRGNNLFHSFLQFNINNNQQVYFTNPTGIENILTRVTGGNISNIFGNLGVDGKANLFLINPNGIFFGNDASVDIKGSLIISSAEKIKFVDATEFSSKPVENTPLLTITSPIGLQFVNNPGKIKIQSKNGLQIPSNKTLALVGGDITLEGTKIETLGGRIELGSIYEQGSVNLTAIQQGFSLGYDNIKTFGNIVISGGTNIDLTSISGAGIKVQTGHLKVTEDSRILSLNIGTVLSGDMTINATDSIEIVGTGNFEKRFAEIINPGTTWADFHNGLFAINFGSANDGDFTINTDKLILRNGAFTLISALSSGSGKNININAYKSVSIVDSLLASVNWFASTGEAGNININTKDIVMENRGLLVSTSLGNGKAGNMSIKAANSIEMTGGETFSEVFLGARINTNINSSSFGNADAGNIEINTPQLTLKNKSLIFTDTFGSGRGGNLTINAASINLTDTNFQPTRAIFTVISSGASGSGNAGNLTVNTDNLQILNSSIESSASGAGNAGNVIINANKAQLLNGGYFSVSTNSSGNAGNLTVNSSDLQIIGTNNYDTGGLYARSRLNATGSAGNITINTNNLQISDNAVISAATLSSGQGGNVDIIGKTLTATNGGKIITTTYNSAKAGNISVKIRDSIMLSGEKTGLFANTEKGATGDSGSIDIDPGIFIIANGAGIGVNSQGTGKGGNISVQAGRLTLDNNAFISATSASSQGGEINLKINDLLWIRHGSDITATAGMAGTGGNGGNININTPFIIGFADENSDITANAFQGNGGNINITTNTIFGLQFRNQLTDFSDITASSQFGLSGQVNINRLDIDPSRGLASLSVNLLNASNQFSPACRREKLASQQNKFSIFSIAGKGGLPSHPHDLFTAISPLVDLVDVSTTKIHQESVMPVVINRKVVNLKNRKLQQAQGWIVTDDGQVILTAQTPKFTMENSFINHSDCFLVNQ